MTATSLFLLATVAACGSSTKPGAAATPTSASASAATTPDTAAPATDAATTTTATTAPTRITFHGRRYCEVLLVTPVNGTPTADVYNSFPLNGCAAAQWDALDAAATATSEGVTLAVKNGPRYWLMDHIEKAASGETKPHKTFGGIEMAFEATVVVGNADRTPYTPHAVTRATTFSFDKGNKVYELTATDGTKYVMQSWSQQVDPALVETDLVGLAARLKLPTGWTFSFRVLTDTLKVVTVDQPAQVLQDDLGNSYSQETAA